MTLDEWADLPEHEEGEFVDGWLVEEEVPDLLHEVIVAWLLEKLGKWSREHLRRDRLDKSAEYAAFGIGWYWLVDPEPLRLEILRRDEAGAYTTALMASAGVIRDVPGCPDLVLDLDELTDYLGRPTRDDESEPDPR